MDQTSDTARKCGHPKTAENTIYQVKDGKRQSNGCRACRNNWAKFCGGCPHRTG